MAGQPSLQLPTPAPPHHLCPRQVSGAVFSWVAPTPTGTEPTTLAASAAVARLIGLDPEEARRPEFALVFSGAGAGGLLGWGCSGGCCCCVSM